MDNKEIEALFKAKEQFHLHRAKLPFEEKLKQIIELQKIDLEFRKHRKDSPAPHMWVWRIKMQ